MKVLYVASSIIPSKSANSVHVMKMAQAISNNGNYNVTMVATDGREEKKIMPFNYYNVIGNFNLKLTRRDKVLSWFYRLSESLKQAKNADIVFTRWLIAAYVLMLTNNKTFIIEFHSYPTNFTQRFLLKRILESKRKRRLIFITKSLHKHFLKCHPQIKNIESFVLPDGADSDLNVSLLPHNSKLECCYVGSFKTGKGVDTVISVANVMKETLFHIVGGTQEEIDAMQSKVKYNNIRFYGHLNQSEAMKVIENSHIALLPNKKNVYIDGTKDIGKWTSPLKLFEYMSKGKAIVASDLPVLKEIIAHNHNSILVESENIRDWKEAIEKLINDENLYNKITRNAKNDLESYYTWEIRAKSALKNL
ncbi:glycosyltransferase [Terribacillus saccharophilus]|uniref:glycosyltransferase n=1 Tax=Terribacillus saccharophilus TaxID=361277 RepID=UPI003982B072